MKKNLLLIPVALTTLTPAISLVGCGDPDTPEPPEYEDVNFKWSSEFWEFQSEKKNFEKDKKYHLVINNCPVYIFGDNPVVIKFYLSEIIGKPLVPNAKIEKVLANGGSIHFEYGPGPTVSSPYIIQIFLEEPSDIEVYMVFKEKYVDGLFEVC